MLVIEISLKYSLLDEAQFLCYHIVISVARLPSTQRTLSAKFNFFSSIVIKTSCLWLFLTWGGLLSSSVFSRALYQSLPSSVASFLPFKDQEHEGGVAEQCVLISKLCRMRMSQGKPWDALLKLVAGRCAGHYESLMTITSRSFSSFTSLGDKN